MIGIDSDCIIDFLKGKKEAIEIIEEHKEDIITTEINSYEVLLGIYLRKDISKEEENLAKQFFESIQKFPFDKKCGEISAKILSDLIKKGEEINQNDCFISAILTKNKINRIITRNKKHFNKIKGIEIIEY